MTKITVAKRNGIEEIHRPGCADLKKTRRRGKVVYGSDRDDWTLEVKTLRDLYASYWDCIADEAVANGDYETLEDCWWAWRGEFELFPCAGNIPDMDEPKAPAKPAKRTRKAKTAPAPEPEPAKGRGHRQYATKDVSPTMEKFAEWIAREFPELRRPLDGTVDARLVMIASKCYRAFQASDLNV